MLRYGEPERAPLRKRAAGLELMAAGESIALGATLSVLPGRRFRDQRVQRAQIVAAPVLADIADPLLILGPLGRQLLVRDLDRAFAEREQP